MNAFILRNFHQFESALAQRISEFGVGEMRDLQVPVSATITSAAEVVSFHAARPSEDLAIAASLIRSLEYVQIEAALKEGRIAETRVANTHTLRFRVNADMALQCHVESREWDLAQFGMAAFGLIHEYVAAMVGRPQSVFSHSIFLAYSTEDVGPMLGQVPEDPYSKNEATRTIPLVSLPIGRWRRELDVCLTNNGEGEFADPWISGVLAPVLRLRAKWDELTIEERQRAAGQITAQDWRRAILEKECQNSVPSND